jgi:hypothetical protein
MNEAPLAVRSWRTRGWLLLALMLLPAIAALAWRILQVSEERAYQATRESLAASLNALVAERLAQGGQRAEDALAANPFALLRWQPDEYCGELRQAEEARRGCWYYLPERHWVLYRSRFFDRWQGSGDELHLFRLEAVPEQMRNASQFTGSVVGVELVPIDDFAATREQQR